MKKNAKLRQDEKRKMGRLWRRKNVSDTAGNTMYKVGDTIELFSANDAPVPLAMSFPAIKEFKDVCKKGVSNKSLSAKQASRMVELGQLFSFHHIQQLVLS